MSAGDTPRVAGVIGWPVKHSLSPRLHAFWLERYGLIGNYVPLAVRPQVLEQAITALPALGFCGANVTVPHKEMAVSLVHRVHPLAKRIGAVNTIVVDAKGRLEGRNTDAFGFLAHLQKSAPGWQPAGATAMIVGAGGAGRAAAVALLDAGVEKLYLVNRTRERAEALAEALADRRAVAAAWQERSLLLKEVQLVANTTTLGMKGQPPLDLELSLLPAQSVVYDIVYTPLETELLRKARARGLIAVDGLGMLIHQAIPAFEAFYGHRPEADAQTWSHLQAALQP